MEQKVVQKVLKIKGMTCTSCEGRIERELKKLDGVMEVKASFSSSTVKVRYNESVVDIHKIINSIEKIDYRVVNQNAGGHLNGAQNKEDKMSINQLLGIGIIIFSIYVIIKNTVGFNFIPQVSQNMSYGILFVVGLITSLHCVAMCGGINLSQCVSYNSDRGNSKLSKLKPSLLYNAGRVISYTIIGGIVGALGSVVSFSGSAKGVVAVISGAFMLIMGLNMLNIFPWLRKLNPRMPKVFANKVHHSSKNGPFYVGLLNGLMPCGPLQAMQIYALGTGSFTAGALSMFLFSLGTVPLMFGLGAVSSFLSGKFTRGMMKASAVLVMVLGIIMINRGLSLSGYSLALNSQASGNVASIQGNVQLVSTTLDSGKYTPIIVQKGIPVKWTIYATADNLNGCDNPVTIPKYNIEKKLTPGDNIIEFTPQEEGKITYTCWMGMISSTITVVSDITKVTNKDIAEANDQSQSNNGLAGGCCAAGAQATKFAGGRIPTDNIGLAKVENGTQEVSINVSDQGYDPAVVVLQKGIKAKIKFMGQKLNSCNNTVLFPEYSGELQLNPGETDMSDIEPKTDFTFQCWMGMLHGYVKVVDDINNVNINEIKNEVENYKPTNGFGGGGCCGG